VLVEFAKRKDGAGVLRCVRGSVTWQKQTERHAAYFAPHDLTHFAVESVLGYSRGFFGLFREGWDFDDTTGKGAKGPLPAEEFCDSLSRKLTEDELARVRHRRSELFTEWAAIEPGSVLHLKFPS
jgi:hypothetical protein